MMTTDQLRTLMQHVEAECAFALTAMEQGFGMDESEVAKAEVAWQMGFLEDRNPDPAEMIGCLLNVAEAARRRLRRHGKDEVIATTEESERF